MRIRVRRMPHRSKSVTAIITYIRSKNHDQNLSLQDHLETLHINNMYKNDFYWTWDKTDDEIDAVFTVADALRDLRERNKSTKVFNSGLGISIFRDNSTRTRFSFASACNLLGLEDAGSRREVSPRSPTARPSARPPTWSPSWLTSSASATICTSVEGHEYQKTFMDALRRGLPRRYPRAAPDARQPPVRRRPSHPVHGRYAAHHPLLRRRGEPQGQEGRHDLGLFPQLRQAPVRPAGRHRPVHPLRHGRHPGPSRGL